MLGKLTALIGDKSFIATKEHPSVADIACYCELDQIDSMGIIDFSQFPTIHAWMNRMKVYNYNYIAIGIA